MLAGLLVRSICLPGKSVPVDQANDSCYTGLWQQLMVASDLACSPGLQCGIDAYAHISYNVWCWVTMLHRFTIILLKCCLAWCSDPSWWIVCLKPVLKQFSSNRYDQPTVFKNVVNIWSCSFAIRVLWRHGPANKLSLCCRSVRYLRPVFLLN